MANLVRGSIWTLPVVKEGSTCTVIWKDGMKDHMRERGGAPQLVMMMTVACRLIEKRVMRGAPEPGSQPP
eukprot:3942373-Karenia_brevis.AAC.1